MLNADSVLTPPTPEELTARLQKRLVMIDAIFPGLVEKTREWMKSAAFARLFIKAKSKTRAPLASRAVRMSIVPVSMKVQVARLAGLSGLISSELDYAADHYDLIECVADMLWKEAEMPSKFWELGTISVSDRFRI